jgi:hypothetical protein
MLNYSRFSFCHQPALSEYDFTIRSLFEDLQDGIILCRVVQLLLSDSSIISVRICFCHVNQSDATAI